MSSNEINESKVVDVILETQTRLVNAVYNNPELLDNVDYSEDLYLDSTLKAISRSIASLVKEGVPLSKEALYTEAGKFKMDITHNEIDYVVNYSQDKITVIKDMVKTLKTAKRTEKALDSLDSVRSVLTSNVVLTPEIRDSLKNDLYEIEDNILVDQDNNFKKAMTTTEWMEDYVKEYKKRKDGKQYYFNEPVLDQIVVDGPIPETGGIIAAQSGMGKSTFVLNLVNKFIDSGIPCMYFSLEMGAVSTMDRLLSARLKIPYQDIVNPPDSETFYTIYQRITEERRKIEFNRNFRFSENPDISISELKKEIKKFQNDIGQQYCVVIIDLITMVKDFCIGSSSGASLATTIEMAINKMNALSKELKIHYIGTAQLNRTGESATVTDIEDIDKFRPSRHQIKNSGALLERCRYAISLFRKKFYIDQYFPEDEIAQAEEDTIEVQLLKQSNGECKRYYELFNGQCFTVTPKVDSENSLVDED